MLTGLMLIVAYILPLPILGACLYFHAFSSVEDLKTRLIALAVISLAPSALLMLFVLKRVVHLILSIALIAALLYALQHFGLIGFSKS